MEAPTTNRPQTPSQQTKHWWADPYLAGFAGLYLVALIVTTIVAPDGWFSILLGGGIVAAAWLVWWRSRNDAPPPTALHSPLEFRVSIGWYLLFMLCSAIWKGEGFLSNEIGKWLWFVVVPLGLVWRARGIPKTTIAALLRSIGWRRQGLGTAVRLGFTAFLVVAPLAIWSFSATQQQKLWAVMQQPLKLFTLLPISFLLALFTAGITEEVFFRGIIQSRLAGAMGSEMRGCVITAFLFGIYHLPYAYFMTSWPTHGNFFWALSAVITEQAITGWLMGILWMRTRHLAASIVFHASVNTLAVLTMLKY